MSPQKKKTKTNLPVNLLVQYHSFGFLVLTYKFDSIISLSRVDAAWSSSGVDVNSFSSVLLVLDCPLLICVY